MIIKMSGVITIFFIFIFSTFAQDVVNDDITEEYLIQGRWSEPFGGGSELVFRFSDGLQYTKNSVYEDGTRIEDQSGIVIIDGDTLTFNEWDGAQRTAKIVINNNSLEFRERLIFDDDKKYYNNRLTFVKMGDEIIWEGSAISIINKYGVTNANVRVRVGPGIDFDPFDMSDISYLSDLTNKTVFPKNRQLYVVGRTLEPEQIGDWNNYWFLVTIPVHAMGGGIEKWVFGEFVDIKE